MLLTDCGPSPVRLSSKMRPQTLKARSEGALDVAPAVFVLATCSHLQQSSNRPLPRDLGWVPRDLVGTNPNAALY